MKNIFLLIFLLTAVKPVNAQELSLTGSIEQCKSIKNDVNRLECYDKISQSKPDSLENNSEKQIEKAISQNHFPELLADLNEPKLFISRGKLDFLGRDFDAILLGVGGRKKITSFNTDERGSSWDINLFSSIRSQFDIQDLSTRNNRGGALINTDFSIGGEIVKSFSSSTVRFRYTHRSVHLGDEFLIDNPEFIDNRLNLSYETIDLMAFHQAFEHWGIYYGGSFITRSEPGPLDKFAAQAGVQYKGVRHNWFRPIAGIDLSSWGETNWHTNVSFKAGIEVIDLIDFPFQLMFEYYEGKSPYGQFIQEDLEYLGISVNYHW